jgi:hypothetical protein
VNCAPWAGVQFPRGAGEISAPHSPSPKRAQRLTHPEGGTSTLDGCCARLRWNFYEETNTSLVERDTHAVSSHARELKSGGHREDWTRDYRRPTLSQIHSGGERGRRRNLRAFQVKWFRAWNAHFRLKLHVTRPVAIVKRAKAQWAEYSGQMSCVDFSPVEIYMILDIL